MDDIITQITDGISDIVKIPSYYQKPQAGMPFGKPCADALCHFLSTAQSMGFETRNYDNYAGEVIFGEGEEFAILVHLDVVPAGGGWSKDPFGGEKDYVKNRVWGRGTMDDKGPAVICLYALKALKDEGFIPKRKIKLIAGCNEESGWKCIDYYKAHAHMPDEGFSPDANFPVIYAEKGILHAQFIFRGAGKGFKNLNGGERANMVCDYCSVNAEGDAAAYSLTREGEVVVSRGKSAHGSTPEKGVNAIKPMLEFLGLSEAEKMLFEDKMGLDGLQDETGPLTFSPDVIAQDGDDVLVTCDIRYPSTIAPEKILGILDGYGAEYKVLNHQLPLFNDKNSKLIQTLCAVYNDVCGTAIAPIAIGGGTYARALKYGAAFGPEEDGEEATIHQPDEYITFEKIEKCFKIYKQAVSRLCG